ncbi:MAG: alpha/beta hydrolase [Acidimicrobiales bacterium mtb01]|nr:MAG: alpha/beta hydrolase [Acidimicrobiales bacterium mtb01]
MQVDIEPRVDRRQAGYEEDVVVRQVVGRLVVDELHKKGRHRLGGSLTPVVNRPVVLVHGWGGSFDTTWKSSGLVDLLADAGREVIGVDLLGHGTAPKPHDPIEYADLTSRVLDVIGDRQVDAVGFSLGAMTLLRVAIDHPSSVNKLVLGGIGRNVLDPRDEAAHDRLVDALEGRGDPDDNIARLFMQYADSPGNDRVALTAVMKRPSRPFDPTELERVTAHTLVTIGDKDFAGPGDPLASALPNARLVTLRNCDHFATTENFGFFDAVLDFLVN